MTSQPVVTRFAPSPTGFLHIGGARTALYNWLLARSTGGKFVMRIEDTDKARSTQEAVDAIFDGMSWLGLTWDGDAISQASRADRHAEIAARLLESGNAYHCFATPEENATAREAARAEGRAFLGDLWRDRDLAEAPADAKPVVRMKMPRDGALTIEDKVQGTVTVQNTVLDDLVILRADGSPTYMLSVVVDDHDMGITHVVRGDDHLNNAFKQVQIYKALGWNVPTFAHIPLIHGPDGKKLSKRHGALGVDGYRDMGYLPEAVNNYLLRLGWAHGDMEIISEKEALDLFSLKGVGKSAARFDTVKLDSLNAHYMKEASAERLYNLIEHELRAEQQSEIDADSKARILLALPDLTERAKRLGDLVPGAKLFCNMKSLSLSDEQVAKVKVDILSDVLSALPEESDWSADAIKSALTDLASSRNEKMGAVMQPVRLAVTLGLPAADLTKTMAILGREIVFQRLNSALEKAGSDT